MQYFSSIAVWVFLPACKLTSDWTAATCASSAVTFKFCHNVLTAAHRSCYASDVMHVKMIHAMLVWLQDLLIGKKDCLL